jgi:hypothetical protein
VGQTGSDRRCWAGLDEAGSIPAPLPNGPIMSAAIRFSWQTFQIIEKHGFGGAFPSPLYNVYEGPGFFDGISARDTTLYHPLQFGPKNLVHLRIRRALRAKFNIEVRERNFPYVLFLPEFERDIRFGAFFHFFLPNILSTRLVCHTKLNFDKTKAFELRQLSNHPIFTEVIKSCAEAAGVKNGQTLTSKSLMEIVLDYSTPIKSEEPYFSALLINDQNKHNISVQKAIQEKNITHNLKGDVYRTILIDKQGYLAALNPIVASDVTVREEIKRKRHLFELAIAIQVFLESYPKIRLENELEADYLYYAISPYIRDQDVVFNLSYSNRLAWQLLVREFALDKALEIKRRSDAGRAEWARDLFDRFPVPRYSSADFWAQIRGRSDSANTQRS